MSEDKGAMESREGLAASASGPISAFQRAAGEIAVEETISVVGRLLLSALEDFLVQRRERAGWIGVAGIAGQRKGLAAAAPEIDLPELAAFARLRHPAGAAIAIKRLRVLPDPGDRMVRPHRQEFKPGDALRRVARQD